MTLSEEVNHTRASLYVAYDASLSLSQKRLPFL